MDRIAPAAAKGEAQSSLTVYCRLETTAAELRPGMTGYARVYTGRRPIGAIALERAMHFVRPEFWWWWAPALFLTTATSPTPVLVRSPRNLTGEQEAAPVPTGAPQPPLPLHLPRRILYLGTLTKHVLRRG